MVVLEGSVWVGRGSGWFEVGCVRFACLWAYVGSMGRAVLCVLGLVGVEVVGSGFD